MFEWCNLNFDKSMYFLRGGQHEILGVAGD